MECPELVIDVCRQSNWECRDNRATLKLPNGRHQVLTLETFAFEGQEMLRIHTAIGPVDALSPIQINGVLGLNFSLPYGKLAIAGGELVMTDTCAIGTDHRYHEQLTRVMYFLAETADRYEREIYHTDEH